ncbi:lipopolysaccharide biosynthesis protein BplA [Vibrio vulnificus]|uniref:lipopolysaccharide biosynthesis protein BplA n=1 Tax=Vibrio vulnificus TaxID=672 RepID=UPI0029405706|nr:lipopolysaccharide biosynthesis protein BplA [Vibrio vulnificus]ELR8547949.1 lipopolysaccharide biosynthesis protein BplA [Vibrio vulnificus]ELR8552703.1 lipopolysaccharide biosynthesis protein BplA [Vibrio vulnificus]
MTNYANKIESRESFTDIVRKTPSIAPLADSQVLQGINTFQGLAIEYALHSVERAKQDSFISTALNRSSILAGAEDRQYLPRKVTPSRGPFSVTNGTECDLSITADTILYSEDQTPFSVESSIVVRAGETVEGVLIQRYSHEETFHVENTQAFYECMLDKKISAKAYALSVFVKEPNSDVYERWTYKQKFMNCTPTDKAFDEFYSHLDQTGIRFGNGVFGAIPIKGSEVKLVVWLSDGAVTLMPKQPLISDKEELEELKFETSGVISGGAQRESTEELRRNALYYPLYDHSLVWESDYVFYINRHFPTLSFLKVWGEAEQEAMDGKNVDNVNAIFICAYDSVDEHISQKIATHLKKMAPEYNRKFTPVSVRLKKFSVSISAKVSQEITLSEATSQVMERLKVNYHANSKSRKDRPLIRDVYKILNSLGFFVSEEDIDVSFSGEYEPERLSDLVCIDLEAQAECISLRY